jgi:hypothetical protein
MSSPDVFSEREKRQRRARTVVAPRCLDREQAAVYLGSSPDVIDRLIQTGALATVRLPVERDRRTNKGTPGTSRRVLLDIRDLDALVDRSKETNGNGGER